MNYNENLEGIIYILIGGFLLLYMLKEEKKDKTTSFTTKMRGYGISIILIIVGILALFFRK